jgi:hypothetical protein
MTQQLVNDYAELLRILKLQGSVIIGIEGCTGSGKTTLANTLGRDLSIPVVSTDNYLAKDPTLIRYPYSDRLIYNRLCEDIEIKVDGGMPIIIEGICLRQSLQKLPLEVQLYVYIKALGTNGLWYEGLSIETGSSSDLEEPELSDFFYHIKEKPHDIANVIFHRIIPDS